MPALTSADGTRIAWGKGGSGPPVVLVDGAFCFRASGVTPKLMPVLSKHFTVYAYDRRGRGESGDSSSYTVDREIEDLKAVVQATGDTASILAFSSGAALALRAVAKGLKVRRLALYEPPYVADEHVNPRQWRDAATDIKGLVAEGRRSDAVSYFMTRIFGAPRFVVALMKLLARDSWRKNESVAHTLPYDIEIMGDYRVPSAVAASVTAPTIVIGGSKSPTKLRNAVQATAAAIPGAEVRWLAKQRHNVNMEVLTPVVTEFFGR